MKWLHGNVGATQSAFQQAPEVFHAVGVNAATNVFPKMIHHFVSILFGQLIVVRGLIRVDCGTKFHDMGPSEKYPYLVIPNRREAEQHEAQQGGICSWLGSCGDGAYPVGDQLLSA